MTTSPSRLAPRPTLVERYRGWLGEQRAAVSSLPDGRRETGEQLLELGGFAAGRIERGIDVLATDPGALDAFRVALWVGQRP